MRRAWATSVVVSWVVVFAAILADLSPLAILAIAAFPATFHRKVLQ